MGDQTSYPDLPAGGYDCRGHIVNVIIAFAGPKTQVIEVEETENESEEE